VIAISFGTPYWLQSVPSDQLPEPKFTNLGLWAVCLNGFHDMRHQYELKWYGCKHILLEEYDVIRSELQPPFFVATQFFFTLSLMGMIVAITFIVMYLMCVNDYYRVSVLRWTAIDLVVSGAVGTLALIIFGSLGDGRDFMPDWEHNYLSWSFGLGFLGVIFEYIAGILFYVEARIITRKELAREKQHPLEQRV
jgi:hypothetical protein